MITSSYEELSSRFQSKITDFSFPKLTDDEYYEVIIDYVHNATSKTFIRKIFSTLVFDDILLQFHYELKNSTGDTDEDTETVLDLLTDGMAIAWLEPKVNSSEHLATMIGNDKEKKLIDNYSTNINKLKDMKKAYKKAIRDYGNINNSYLNGDT